MVRCKYIIKAIKKDNLLDNVTKMGNLLSTEIKKSTIITDIRQTGLLLAIDFISKDIRDKFVTKLYNNGIICNATGKKTVRMRPNLAVTEYEVARALDIINKVVGNIK